MWLGHDAGHEDFTADLAAALHPHLPLKMLVRDAGAEAEARALLARRNVPADRVQSCTTRRRSSSPATRPCSASTRWAAWRWWTSAGATTAGRPGADVAMPATSGLRQRCADADEGPADALDRDLADTSAPSVFRSSLAMEGGGVEVNGQGLLIANEALWTSRNPGRSRPRSNVNCCDCRGIRKVIWLPAGLAQDPLHRATVTGRHVAWGTGGHTDEFVRFADPRTVLLAWPDADEAARHPVSRLNLQRMQRNFAILSRATDVQGRPLRVLKLPLPNGSSSARSSCRPAPTPPVPRVDGRVVPRPATGAARGTG
jgi:agmatine/peptidylarginine deiminase